MSQTLKIIKGIISLNLRVNCHTRTYHTHVSVTKSKVYRKYVKGTKTSG